ncbi:MAG: hypothetical protein J0M20_13225 [Burkholderiales bacterium]|nr:hypothetical protein [Burkholderiales bacterium]
MNILSLDLRPLWPANCWDTHPTELARRSPGFASMQRDAAAWARNPCYYLTDSDYLCELPARIPTPYPVMVIYVPFGLSNHVQEVAVTVPRIIIRDAADYQARADYLTWPVRGLNVCVALPLVLSLVEAMAEPPSHVAVMFVGRECAAVQVLALDMDFWEAVDDCLAQLDHGHLSVPPDCVPWLADYEHRGPCFLYPDDPDLARDGDDAVWVYLEPQVWHFNEGSLTRSARLEGAIGRAEPSVA